MSLHAGDRVTHFLRPDEVFEIIQVGPSMAQIQRYRAHPDDQVEPFWCAQSVLHRVEVAP